MHVFARNFACQLEKALTELGHEVSLYLKDYVEKSFLKYINNDAVPLWGAVCFNNTYVAYIILVSTYNSYITL